MQGEDSTFIGITKTKRELAYLGMTYFVYNYIPLYWLKEVGGSLSYKTLKRTRQVSICHTYYLR